MKTDTETLLTLLEEARKYKLSLGDTAWGDCPFTEEDIVLRLNSDGCYVVEIDGSLAGSISLIWDDEHNWGEVGVNKQAGYIHELMVSGNFRGQKIGEHMIVWAIEQTKAKNRSFVRLDCHADNTKLCNYYEELGFKCRSTKNGSVFYEHSV